MIGSQRQSVEVFRREGEKWTYRHYRPGQEVVLESLDITLSFADIYCSGESASGKQRYALTRGG